MNAREKLDSVFQALRQAEETLGRLGSPAAKEAAERAFHAQGTVLGLLTEIRECGHHDTH